MTMCHAVTVYGHAVLQHRSTGFALLRMIVLIYVLRPVRLPIPDLPRSVGGVQFGSTRFLHAGSSRYQSTSQNREGPIRVCP